MRSVVEPQHTAGQVETETIKWKNSATTSPQGNTANQEQLAKLHNKFQQTSKSTSRFLFVSLNSKKNVFLFFFEANVLKGGVTVTHAREDHGEEAACGTFEDATHKRKKNKQKQQQGLTPDYKLYLWALRMVATALPLSTTPTLTVFVTLMDS